MVSLLFPYKQVNDLDIRCQWQPARPIRMDLWSREASGAGRRDVSAPRCAPGLGCSLPRQLEIRRIRDTILEQVTIFPR